MRRRAERSWISQQASEEITRGQNGETGRRWRELRMDMTRLLIAGLNREPNPIPARLDSDIWIIITDCCRDPDPTTQREGEPTAEPHSRYRSLALTANRAQAVHAAICYGLRIRRRTPEADLTRVRVILDRHLDTQAEPSCVVRSVYGQLFAQLTWMDNDWAARNADSIFPADPAQQELLTTAWDAYLTGGQPTDGT